MFPSLLLPLLLLFIAAPLCAQDALLVDTIITANSFTLRDGRTIKCEGIQTSDETSLAPLARKALEEVLGNRPVQLEHESLDRYRRTVAQVYAVAEHGDKVWAQGTLLKAGWAFVVPQTGDEDHVSDMLALEHEARMAKRGLWADPSYADIKPEDAKNHYGAYVFISGKIVDAAFVHGTTYLNFGFNWREDFKVEISAHNLHNFTEAKVDPLSFKNKTVRVRGLIEHHGGALIMVTNPAEIEVVE